MWSSKQGKKRKGYHWSIVGIWKGYLFYRKWYFKGEGVAASSPVACDHWGKFDLIIRESGDDHSQLALYARSHHPFLALLACLACSWVPQSLLRLGKACGRGRRGWTSRVFAYKTLSSTPFPRGEKVRLTCFKSRYCCWLSEVQSLTTAHRYFYVFCQIFPWVAA